MGGDQNAQSSAVDVFDVVHIQDNFLLTFGDQTLQFDTQSLTFLAEHDAPVEGHYRGAIHFAVGHLQCHVGCSCTHQAGSNPTPSDARLSVPFSTANVFFSDCCTAAGSSDRVLRRT